MRRACAPAMLVGLAVLAGANRVPISNLVPRLSIDGRIVNAHDGTIRLIDGARLEFDATGRVRPMRWVDEVTIEL